MTSTAIALRTFFEDDAGNQAIAERVPNLAQSLEVGPADPLLGFDLERQQAAVVELMTKSTSSPS